MDIKRTDFYNELCEEKREQYFSIKREKFMPSIDNIYYGVSFKDDHKENPMVDELMSCLAGLKLEARRNRSPQYFKNDLYVEGIFFKDYKYCLSVPELYDIFIMDNLLTNDTPRVLVQLRAYGLWVHGTDKMISESYDHVRSVFSPIGLEVERIRENRIDYCYHTNAIQSPEKMFSDKNLSGHLKTTMNKIYEVKSIQHMRDGGIYIRKEYLALGQRSSNNVYFRLYNKGLEVIENGYKGFFFEVWRQHGLISEYDLYCYEKALLARDYEGIHRAKLEFYLEYGTNDIVKKEFRLWLDDKNTSAQQIRELAAAYMPEVTTIINIEYETKRKFYYYSDDFIDAVLKTAPERDGVPSPLKRLYKIMDNRGVFLEYLTRKTVSFWQSNKQKVKSDEDIAYSAWWNRLRKTRLEGIDVDLKLVREYSHRLDKKEAQKRFVNSVVTNAVYAGNVKTGFVEDVADLLSNMNDNDVHAQKFKIYGLDGKELERICSEVIGYYAHKKAVKHSRLKNRLCNEAI
jgi:hypothetical protein